MRLHDIRLNLTSDNGETINSNCMGFALFYCGVIRYDSYTWMPVPLLGKFFKQSTKKESDIILMIDRYNQLVHVAAWYDKEANLVIERPGYNMDDTINTLKSSERNYTTRYGKLKKIYLKKK